ncbi:DUF1178 family protein [Ramlibacter sp. AW1]|uniref:DUF1178 family protein n=1 Tax=Ramlibacter aurantiacus TaxID=2801330 RepID=A0A936ZM63_9BURK|nr:DUF1178 family protein [Ramlibacter aurantiacus]MBL0419815.1 DUF1178 family protein [Ramlibacter aurantiacus]
MKVLNLQCSSSHAFEGWFGSEDDFQDQLQRGLLECPLCGDTQVAKLPSAPRLNFGAPEPKASAPAPTPGTEAVAPTPAALQAAYLKMVRQVLASTEDVGERFAEEARRMHYGEAQERGIRGQASAEDTQALLEEGIAVLPLPIPKALKEPLQ